MESENKGLAPATQYEKYEVITIKREDLKNAPYNPRTITEKARKRLKENLGTVGLLGPIVWNRKTGNIVSGHRRIESLDALHKTKDYTLRVAAVELDEKTEKEQCVFMNNPEAQGEWDLAKLELLIKVDKIEIESSGFDVGNIYQLFGDTPLIEQPEALATLAEQLRTVSARMEEVREKNQDRDDVNFYLVVVFKDHKSRKVFTDQFELPDNRFVDGRELQKLILKGD